VDPHAAVKTEEELIREKLKNTIALETPRNIVWGNESAHNGTGGDRMNADWIGLLHPGRDDTVQKEEKEEAENTQGNDIDSR
jgi:hypothetical protein